MKLEHTRIALRWAWHVVSLWGPVCEALNVCRGIVSDLRREPISDHEAARRDLTTVRRRPAPLDREAA